MRVVRSGRKCGIVSRSHAHSIISDPHLAGARQNVYAFLYTCVIVIWEGCLAGLQLHPVETDRLGAGGRAETFPRGSKPPFWSAYGVNLIHVHDLRMSSCVHAGTSSALRRSKHDM